MQELPYLLLCTPQEFPLLLNSLSGKGQSLEVPINKINLLYLFYKLHNIIIYGQIAISAFVLLKQVGWEIEMGEGGGEGKKTNYNACHKSLKQRGHLVSENFLILRMYSTTYVGLAQG